MFLWSSHLKANIPTDLLKQKQTRKPYLEKCLFSPQPVSAKPCNEWRWLCIDAQHVMITTFANTKKRRMSRFDMLASFVF